MAFDPERQRAAPGTHGGGCSTPTGGRKFRSLICIATRSRELVSDDACDAAESNVSSGTISGIFFGVCVPV